MTNKQQAILWGVKVGDEDWAEQLITATSNKAHLNKAKEWALKNGFNRLRVGKFTDGEMPNFIGTISGSQPPQKG